MTVAAPPTSRLRRLIVCADDFALHAGASQGITQLAAQGRLSATSALVLSPRWALDAPRLRDLRGQLDVGLHLDWTSAFARAQGHGRPLARVMARALLGGLRPDQARPVIEQQLDAFEAYWQAPPDHVDGHQHVQQFAGIRTALVQALLARYGRGPMPYLRISRPARPRAELKSRLIASLGADALENIAKNAGVTRARALFGTYDFGRNEAAYARRMTAWLADVPDGAILMCHPAGPAPAQADSAAARQAELAYLAGPRWPEALARAGVQLARGAAALA